MSISFAPELGDAVLEAAERAGMTLSEWLAGPGDQLYPSDPDDLRKLCGAAGNDVSVIGC